MVYFKQIEIMDVKVSNYNHIESTKVCLRILSNLKKSGKKKDEVRQFKKSFVDENWDRV